MELITHLLFIVSTLVIGANGGFIFADYLNKREKERKKSEALNPPCGNQHLIIKGESSNETAPE